MQLTEIDVNEAIPIFCRLIVKAKVKKQKSINDRKLAAKHKIT